MNPSPSTSEPRLIVAVDGFSSCGKSTIAKHLAKALSYVYIDTGAMYRAVALFALQQGLMQDTHIDTEALVARLGDIDLSFVPAGEGKSHICLNGVDVETDIRGMEVSRAVSFVAKIPEVREAMVDLQRKIGAAKGVVMDGRDIGTVVFPQAELKVFVQADPEVRARRRFDELKAKGQETPYQDILDNLRLRDHNDLTRSVAPLQKAEDALVLDNSRMTLEQQDAWMLQRFNEVLHAHR